MKPSSLKSLIEKSVTLPFAAGLLFLANSGALAFAFAMQYGFNFEPCYLCIWQRFPYGAAAVLSLAALLWKPYGKQTTVLLACCSLSYIAGAGLAFFHSGVERHWWKGTQECRVTIPESLSVEELRQSLLEATTARCDVIQGTLFGLSMTNWNVLAFLGLAVFTVYLIHKNK